jgi:zinc protease
MTPDVCPGTPIAAQSPDAWDLPVLNVVRKTLANGLRVILAENHTVPLVFLSWTSQAGFESDPPRLEGLASLTPLLLREGTAHRSASQITQELDDLGADLAPGSDWSSAFLNLELLTCDFAAGAELLLDMACGARFPDAAVVRLRQRRLAELELRRRDPRALADDELARALFGETVYGRSPLGTPTTVQRINAADLAAFHDDHYRPATSYVVVAGSFDSEMVTDLLGSFELPAPIRPSPPLPLSLAPAAEPRAELPNAAAATERQSACHIGDRALGWPGGVHLVNVPHATQTEIRVGHAGVARDSADLPALEVLSGILGGGSASRMARTLRQHEGMTYHIRSRFAARRLGGTFVVNTSVANEATGAALAGIRHEIEKLRDERVPAADVDQVKCRLLGGELRRFQDFFVTGATLGPAALLDDPVYDFERRRQAIATVEPDGLRELARRYLDPERLVAVVVGPAELLQSQFSGDGAHRCQPFSLESIS